MRASRVRTRICGTIKYGRFNSTCGRSSTHKKPRAQSFRTRPDRRSISIAETPQFPSVLRGPIDLPGRHLAADRWPRQRVVIATQGASMLLGFALAALTLTGRIRVWEIIVLATLLGVVNAFDVPARQSFLIEMVGREDLLNAIALNSTMFNGARVA